MGSRKSNTSTTTQNEYFDQRQVNDAGGGVIGSGTVDNSTNWTQAITDARTTTDSGNTTWTQTTNNSDSSTRSYENSGNTTWNSTVTDGGAIDAMESIGLAQAKLAERITQIGAETAGRAMGATIQAQEAALSTVRATNSDAMGLAKTSTAQAFASVSDALGFSSKGMDTMAALTNSLIGSAQRQADQAAGTAQAAYSSAASQANGNKTLTIAALAAVAVVAAAVIFKKG